jgi:hypothetical protein
MFQLLTFEFQELTNWIGLFQNPESCRCLFRHYFCPHDIFERRKTLIILNSQGSSVMAPVKVI